MPRTGVMMVFAGFAVAFAPLPAVAQQGAGGRTTHRLVQSDSGAMLRLTFRHGVPPQTAMLLGWTGDVLRVRGTSQVTDEIPLPNVSRVEIRAAFDRPFARFAFKGFGIGALVGAVLLGFLESQSDSQLLSVQEGALVGAFWLGSAGVVIGWAAAVGGQESWRPVTIDGWSPPTAPP